MKDLDTLAQLYDNARAEAKKFGDKKDQLGAALKEAILRDPEAKNEITSYDVTIQERSVSDIDEEYLQQHLPEDTWNRISSQRLDPAKVMSAIQDGSLDINALTPATNRHKELVKKLPHTLGKVPMGAITATVEMSSKIVTLDGEAKPDGTYTITHASATPPFVVTYRHDGITRILSVKASKNKPKDDAVTKAPTNYQNW